MTLSGPDVLSLRSDADAHGVEWHHAAGHSKGRERISFFPKNEEERAAVDRLAEAVKRNKEALSAKKKADKEKGLPTSKAAVWRGLSETDCGCGSVDYKDGKYGKFVPSFGEPDGKLYFPSADFADRARRILKI